MIIVDIVVSMTADRHRLLLFFRTAGPEILNRYSSRADRLSEPLSAIAPLTSKRSANAQFGYSVVASADRVRPETIHPYNQHNQIFSSNVLYGNFVPIPSVCKLFVCPAKCLIPFFVIMPQTQPNERQVLLNTINRAPLLVNAPFCFLALP